MKLEKADKEVMTTWEGRMGRQTGPPSRFGPVLFTSGCDDSGAMNKAKTTDRDLSFPRHLSEMEKTVDVLFSVGAKIRGSLDFLALLSPMKV